VAEKKLLFHLVTVSTSRFQGRGRNHDESGDIAEKIIKSAGHTVEERKLISDNAKMLRATLGDFLKSRADVLVYAGGTGLSRGDITIETVRPYFNKEIVGFGELLRSKSFENIGAAAMLTRATAGVLKGKLIVCLPGSPDAVETGLRMFISELPHAVHIART